MTIEEVEKLALELPEEQRATLASHLLTSLPPLLTDDDEGLAEALRRDTEMDADPNLGLSLADLERKIRERRCR